MFPDFDINLTRYGYETGSADRTKYKMTKGVIVSPRVVKHELAETPANNFALTLWRLLALTPSRAIGSNW